MVLLNTRRARAGGIGFVGLLTTAAALASLMVGPVPITLRTLVEVAADYDPGSMAHLVLASERLARAVTAVIVGASLAVAGAVIQALTRNAMASPSILGINAGAMMFVVAAASVFTLTSPQQYVWAAFAGASFAAVLVCALGGGARSASAPLQLVLAGLAVTALFISLAQGWLIVNQERLQSILFWLAGSVSGHELEVVRPLLPFFAIAGLACAGLIRHLNLLAVEEDVALALGTRPLLINLAAGAVVVVLAGSAVALAGMIGFVGLIVPHIARAIFGTDHRWLLPASALIGATLLLMADTVARLVMPPQEIPVGVMTALLGTPFSSISRAGEGADTWSPWCFALSVIVWPCAWIHARPSPWPP